MTTEILPLSDDLGRARTWTVTAPLVLLLALLVLHALGVVLDLRAGIRSPIELDYGEGIVWQQAALVPGPRMYSNSQDLPFIVFHYPPLYYAFVHAMAPLAPNLLAAGRLVSALATILIAPLVTALVLTAALRPGRGAGGVDVMVAIAAGLLVLCLPAVRTWGLFMRVDMVAIVFGLSGVLAGARANGRFWGTILALLLCVAAVFTKQTQLPAGVAVFFVALLRGPRNALAAAGIAGTIGLGALGAMQALTDGGFLHNIVGYNINRFSPGTAYRVFAAEHSSFLFMAMMLPAAGLMVSALRPKIAGRFLSGLRQADRPTTARAMLLLHFALATMMLSTAFKSGASINYLLDWLCVGVVVIGVALCDLLDDRRRFVPAILLLLLGVVLQPFRQLPDHPSPEELTLQTALVQRIADAPEPVASENMTLLMQAGKPVIFEPAIATELTLLGKWDETPLVDMIRSGGFAFMITTDDNWGGSPRRSPAIDAAMRAAFPRVEQADPDLWLHLPAD
jgi:hypothetical protein